MNVLAQELRQNPGMVFALIIENNPSAVNDRLNTLSLYSGQASIEEMKAIIDNLYNTRQYNLLRSALNVNYMEGVLPIEFDQAFMEAKQGLKIKKSGNGEVVANYTPLVDSVLDFICQMLGNCAQQQPAPGPGQQQAPPFNWTPVFYIFGGLALVGLAITAIIVFGRKK